MPRTPKRPTVWEIAKPLLEKDLRVGAIGAELPDAKLVHKMKPEYEAVPLANFKRNLAALRIRFVQYKEGAEYGSIALAHDRQLHLVNPNPPNWEYPRWDGSAAQRLLKEDIGNKKHVGVKPQDLRETRDEYKAFPKEVFRKHIQQELRSDRESSYWLSRPKRKNKQHSWA